MSLGFSALAVVELLYFIVAAHGISDIILPVVDIELQHIILFAMLCLFAVGILNFNNSGKGTNIEDKMRKHDRNSRHTVE
jgi:hypothetical protein